MGKKLISVYLVFCFSIVIMFLLLGCSPLKKDILLKFKMQKPVIKYKLSVSPSPDNDTSRLTENFISLNRTDNKEEIEVHWITRFFEQNESTDRIVKCIFSQNTIEEECLINDPRFRMFFELPEHKISMGDKWKLKLPLKNDKYMFRDGVNFWSYGRIDSISTTSVGKEAHISMEYGYKRDVIAAHNPKIHIKDSVVYRANGVFLMENGNGLWKEFRVKLISSVESPKKGNYMESMYFQLQD